VINIYVSEGGLVWTCKDGPDHQPPRSRLSWISKPSEKEWRHAHVRAHCDDAHEGQPYRLVKI
jgi:hypothetical protein